MKKIACAFTGPRPQNLPFGDNEKCLAFARLSESIDEAILRAIDDSYRIFTSGGATGTDLWCAERVLKLKHVHPQIELHFCLPCETQANHWSEEWRERYFDLLAVANDVHYIQLRYSDDCMMRRNRTMIDSSSRLIAVYDGVQQTGGTAYTVRYARGAGLHIDCIWPDFR